jgi:hypothetical protein
MIYGTASAKTIFIIIIGKIMICAKQRLIFLLLFYSYIREMTKTTAEREQ